MKRLLSGLALTGLLTSATIASVHAAPPSNPVKLGVITDMTGSLSAQSGRGSVIAAQMAIDDCLAKECAGMKVELLSADHQNKPDIAVNIVRKWIDVDGVDAVTDIIQAGVQLAIQNLMKEKNRIALFPGGTARLANEDCAPKTSVLWMWDTYGQAVGITRPLAKPDSSWYFVAADYAFGNSLIADATGLVQRAGGKVVGSVKHPFNATGDFASYLLQAQSSGAGIVAIGSTGGDLINMLKQAREFGLGKDKQKVASFVLTLPDVAALGLDITQGITVNEAFYWNLDAQSRAFGKRFFERYQGMPSTIQAGVYSVTLHYLKSVAAAGTTDTAAVMAKMHELPISDATVRNATLRVDGRMEHDSYLFRVKTPAESKEPFDFYELQATIPAKEAFRPLTESVCPALK
ncbi:ABC transporter substrate-binding protein [Rhodopseudomonas sp. P2A-2r]|uniref:ABC transporter substrate-binding protein n=1 Tax=unclassified Rhodopseudomonas TaxID=2638247 RepID=UPI002233EEDE|nr:ABC transporter substrate-binding protein [Rhodopseudomonas sp. P2A-2r]UZE47340.1 ABC transporter substrate-binding protein [Rhodopseudomonas sp. P2A-2r]